jgi:hypothetical protein
VEDGSGVAILADRVKPAFPTRGELDLLKCIGDQFAVTAEPLLTEDSMQSELEAFQTMSTFFIHDLKNAVNPARI